MFEDKKIAIVYDWIDKWGGVERILLTLHEMFPHATFYTSYVDRSGASWAKELTIIPSFIQKFPKFIRGCRIASLPLYPFAFESFNFDAYDVVISTTSSFAKSVITKPNTKHICYLLTPTRFLWSHENEYQNSFQKILTTPFKKYLQKWDFVTAQRPDTMISISETVAKRCRKYYGRDSNVIYPPFDVEYWNEIKSKVKSQKSKLQLKSQKFFLVVSRLEPYKKVDLVVQSFNRLGMNLVIVGVGSREQYLKKIANKNIRFIPYVSDQELARLYSQAEALIMPQEEDFGYVSLEAQFFGCPVVAYKKGGATETIINDKTGLFFPEQTMSSLSKTLEQFHTISYNLKNVIRRLGIKNIERFNKTLFIQKFLTVIKSKVKS